MIEELKHRKILDRVSKFLDDKEIIAIHGSRQVGKTSLLHYIMDNHLKKEIPLSNIFYFDLEDFAFLDLCNQGPGEVVKYIKGKGANSSQKVYLLIDEIQYLENPSSFLKLFHDHYKYHIKLIVSGSSSFLIKKKFKDSLVGRVIDFELFTLDFEEFLYFKGLKYNLSSSSDALCKELVSLYEDYIIYGGYPAIVLEDDTEKKEMKLKQIINTYVKRDIRDIASIRNINKFNSLLRILASQSTNLLNIAEVSNTLGISKKTVEEYISILESTYIIKTICPFHKNIRSELTKMPKIFFEDTGMLNILVNKSFSTTITGQMLETSVYSILRKNMDIENIYFWRTNKAQEVDFILNFPKKKKIVPLEIKLNPSKKYFTNLKYFQEKYFMEEGFLCCLYRRIEKPAKNIKTIYPWQIYKCLSIKNLIGMKETDDTGTNDYLRR